MIRTSRAHLQVEAYSHQGMTGKNNEDRFAVASYQVSKRDVTPILFAVLADGIGGHKGGEVAAELAVNHIMQRVAKSDGQFSHDYIEQAVNEASDAIASHSSTNENLKGMGATCAIAWIIDNKLYTAYVGDSRIYLLRGGRIQQMTVDHSWVQEAIDKGILTPELARDHPNVHVIRRYLGSAVPPEPDFRLHLFDGEGAANAENNQGTELQPNDVLLLCSDGLTDLVWNDEILEVVRSQPNLKGASRALVDLANDRGGHDNITVVLIGVPQDFKPVPMPKKKNERNWLPWIIGGLVGFFLLLIVGSVLALNLIRQDVTKTATPADTATPYILLTYTPLPEPTATPILTETAAPDVAESAEPTATLTPWPTNTIIP
ncbi:MAG TPA: PP2C family serine/threonine-protein phosphatase [Anaerolineales bacterium]|nr:PP2C family serine/threonine-protein phosphatase [Anaerolineales bacterium]